ncbi:MAG: hypothetical protein ABL952_08840 [Pyrinomonadaceae bacterium]
MNAQARASGQKLDLNTAEKCARESVAMYESLNTQNSVFAVGAFVTLGSVLMKRGKLIEGESFLRRGLDVSEKQAQKNYARIIPNWIALTENLVAQKRIAEAQILSQRAVDNAQAHLGEGNSITKNAVENLAKINKIATTKR